MTSPARTAVVPPLLVSVTAAEAGLLPVPPGHPEITGLLAGHKRQGPAPGQIDWHRRARVTLDTDWTVTGARLLQVPSCQQAAARLFEAGQRLLTPYEWEHACGAGATTLFRWGDSCPPGPGPAGTGPHREPNAFGLQIAQDPYRAERTADPAVACGGDGGGMICGGAGAFVSWLTLATAYRDPASPGCCRKTTARTPACTFARQSPCNPHTDRTGTPGLHRAQRMTRAIRTNLIKVRQREPASGPPSPKPTK